MKIRKSPGSGAPEKVEINMTPMIDVVFQLLSFFVMSFKVVVAEGDFNVKMPLAAPRQGVPDDTLLPPMKVRLQADGNGNLASIKLNDNSFGTSFEQLRDYIIGVVGDERGPGSIQETAEVELDCDFGLKYENVVKAITAVSGYKQGDDVVRLVEKIKFSPPRKAAG
ncbi:MAG TPA: biopolymer transporter ExbD [Pirellulaceae bacterium]|nr:biopolymer transporter ExbD [Pirellulaceae bacterium]